MERRESAWRVLVMALLVLAAIEPRAEVPSAWLGSAWPRAYATEVAGSLGFAAFAWHFGGGWRLCGSLFLAPRRIGADVLYALLLGAAIVATETVAAAGESSTLVQVLPRTPLQQAAWCGVAATVATTEELVYRGYLLRELTARTSPIVGALLQAILFGMAHASQGAATTTRFACYGLGFALVKSRRRSLLPCVLTHTALDLWAGLGT